MGNINKDAAEEMFFFPTMLQIPMISRDDELNELRFSTYEEQERLKKGLHLFLSPNPFYPTGRLVSATGDTDQGMSYSLWYPNRPASKPCINHGGGRQRSPTAGYSRKHSWRTA
jgi:hypothetical protein